MEEKRPDPAYPAGKRELIFGAAVLVLALALGNFMLLGGFNLGFGLAGLGILVASAAYLRRGKGTLYGWALLGLCAVILPGFARSDDGFVKFVMVCFLFVDGNLGLTTLAGRNLWNTAGIGSVLDAFRAFFVLGFGKLSPSFRGLKQTFQSGSPAVKKTGSVFLGAVIAVPILAVMIPLLMRADAAFEGLLDLLPEFEMGELVATAIFGGGLGCILYTQAVALRQDGDAAAAPVKDRKRLNSLTMNTVLGAVCLLYGVYLMSQLAYFVGGFAGILPEGYSLAEYARRGFFEMAWLCAINLSVMVLGISVTEKRGTAKPLSTRILCLIIGLVTEFLVFASGAKMVLYIGAYGMTRLRVLTMVIVAFLGLTTAVVSLWLFLPKLPYMKVVLLSALVMGGAVLWADVDTVVAKYNVESYLSGRMAAVDTAHLSTLGSGAVPYLDRLAREAEDEEVRACAGDILRTWYGCHVQDFRDWNYADWVAQDILEGWVITDTELAEGSEQTYYGTVTDRAMGFPDQYGRDSRPYLGVELEDGTGVCFWMDGDTDCAAQIGDYVRVECATESETDLLVLISVTVLERPGEGQN